MVPTLGVVARENVSLGTHPQDRLVADDGRG